jgi:agmatinase
MRGLEGINLIAADIVEVAPAYDTNAELTTMAAAVSNLEMMVDKMLTVYRTCCTRL